MKQTVKVRFFLKKSEVDADGMCPVMGRITVGRSLVHFSTKMKAPLALWDLSIGRPKGKSAQAMTVNRNLDKMNVAINAHYKELCLVKESVTAEQVKNAFQGIASQQETLVKYFERYNEDFSKRVGVNREPSTFYEMQNALRHVRNFLKQKYNLSDIAFTALDMSFIESLDHYLRVGLQRKPNTILGVISRLRRMVRLAVSEGIITHDPFDGFTPLRPKAEQKFLTRDELDKIMNTPLDHPNRYLTRDLFLFACFTGLSLTNK